MTITRGAWGYKLGLASTLAIVGTLVELSLGIITSSRNCALAQIEPDATLGAKRSIVTPNVIRGLPGNQISGGAIQGANLFHSFEEFNINQGQAAYFTNPAGIKNILGRVTGNNRSDIQGTLGVLGNANLFLINPDGLLFGKNARLDVRGSFVATTADAIQFGDQGVFSASAPNALPVLTVNPSAFFFNQLGAQPITVNSRGSVIGRDDGQPLYEGLQVPNRQSLLLLGGKVSLDRGSLNALGGRVELGGLAGAGTVGLKGASNNLSLSFPNRIKRADVSLRDGSKVNVRAEDGGSIAINARNLDILAGSALAAGIVGQDLSFPNRQAGDITLNLTGAVRVADGSFISNHVKNWLVSGVGAKAKGGDVTIEAESVSVTSGAAVSASVFGKGGGDAGSVTINARGPVSFDGVGSSSGVQSRAVSSVAGGSRGKGGDVTIEAESLSVTDGAVLSTNTFGKGDAGDVTIKAEGPVSVDGVAGSRSSEVVARVLGKAAEGKGGDVTIEAESLSVTDGAVLSASTFGKGDAGDITINARGPVSFDGVGSNGGPSRAVSAVGKLGSAMGRGKGGDVTIKAESLSVTNGAALAATSEAQGNAGNVIIRARGPVSFDGVNREFPSKAGSEVYPDSVGEGGDVIIESGSLSVTGGALLTAATEGRGDAGNVTIRARDTVSFDGVNGKFRSTALSSVEAGAVGDGGNINIKTGLFSVTNGAGLTTSSQGNGTAGNIGIEASSIRLDGKAFLRSDTIAGKGNIFLSSQNVLLSRGSSITTNAQGTATGGNITINTDILAALENSDISARAKEGSGGQVKIDAQGIFGTEFRDQLTPESDITATSELGPEFSGTVEINTPDIDPDQGLVALPVEVIDASGLIAQGCLTDVGPAASKFVLTGRGGLPPAPRETVSSDTILEDWGNPLWARQPQSLDHSVGSSPYQSLKRLSSHPADSTPESNSTPIVEAQGWVMGSRGEVVLTAQAPTMTPHSSKPSTPNCLARP